MTRPPRCSPRWRMQDAPRSLRTTLDLLSHRRPRRWRRSWSRSSPSSRRSASTPTVTITEGSPHIGNRRPDPRTSSARTICVRSSVPRNLTGTSPPASWSAATPQRTPYPVTQWPILRSIRPPPRHRADLRPGICRLLALHRLRHDRIHRDIQGANVRGRAPRPGGGLPMAADHDLLHRPGAPWENGDEAERARRRGLGRRWTRGDVYKPL
jgi:hypothetical protein